MKDLPATGCLREPRPRTNPPSRLPHGESVPREAEGASARPPAARLVSPGLSGTGTALRTWRTSPARLPAPKLNWLRELSLRAFDNGIQVPGILIVFVTDVLGHFKVSLERRGPVDNPGPG